MTKPAMVVFPGASLMEIITRPWGVEVCCPGCGLVKHFQMNGTKHAQFIHGDGCAVLAKIQAATKQYEQTVVKRG